MGWTAPTTATPGSVISASGYGNIVRDDLNYLLSERPVANTRASTSLSLTATGTGWTDAGTAWQATITLSGSRARVSAQLQAAMTNTSGAIGYFQLTCGTAESGTLAAIIENQSSFLALEWYFEGLNAGSYNCRVQMKTNGVGGTASLTSSRFAIIHAAEV